MVAERYQPHGASNLIEHFDADDLTGHMLQGDHALPQSERLPLASAVTRRATSSHI